MRKTTALLVAPLTLALMGGTALAAGQSSNMNTTGTAKVNSSDTTNSTAGNTMNSAGSSTGGTMNSTTTDTGSTMSGNKMSNGAAANATGTKKTANGDTADAKDIVNAATKVVNQMKSDDNVASLLKKAKGVYIVPDFGRGGLIVGGRGGAGVMLAKHDGKWTDPAFFNFGGVSIGAQAGASGGSVAFILMSKDAVNAFKNGNQFSLNSGAGLSIVNYSANTQASAGKGDIVFWSDTEGAYAGATISVSDVGWANANNKGYYGKKVSASKLISGQVATKKGEKLKSALSG